MHPLSDAQYMREAIAVAMGNLGRTMPNPTVGCVLVKDGVVIGRGVTGAGGRPHAEEQALAEAGEAARGAACYVSLEPCGQRSVGTASCAERLIAAGVARVVIACEDVSPFAAGQGLERLRAAGIPTEIGLLADEAEVLSAGFRHRLATGRPLVYAARGPETYEGPFEPLPGEALEAALDRYGQAFFSRLWTPQNGPVARQLAAKGWLAEAPREAKR